MAYIALEVETIGIQALKVETIGIQILDNNIGGRDYRHTELYRVWTSQDRTTGIYAETIGIYI